MYRWVGVGFSLDRRFASRDRGLWTRVLGTHSPQGKLITRPCGALRGTKVGRHQSCLKTFTPLTRLVSATTANSGLPNPRLRSFPRAPAAGPRGGNSHY